MRARPRWLIPAGLLATGFALVAGGLAWAAHTGILLPYPDAPPDVRAYEAFHHRIVDALLLGGFVAVAVGLVWGVAAWVASRFSTGGR